MSSGGLTCQRYDLCLSVLIPFILYVPRHYLLYLVGIGNLNEIAFWA